MITYNQQTRRFERDGVPVTDEELRQLIDKLTLQTQREARRLSGRLERGEIDREQWLVAMLALLKAAHVVAVSVGSGGIAQVSDQRWKKAENKVRWQSAFLTRFGAAIAAGSFVGSIASRAAKYASAIYTTYANAFQESQTAGKDEQEMRCRLVQNSQEGCSECAADASAGWMPVSEMGEIGSRICGDYCKCDIEFEDEVMQ